MKIMIQNKVGIIALQEFGEMACFSLRPKSKLRKHYIQQYKMKATGQLLSLELPDLIELINEYE